MVGGWARGRRVKTEVCGLEFGGCGPRWAWRMVDQWTTGWGIMVRTDVSGLEF